MSGMAKAPKIMRRNDMGRIDKIARAGYHRFWTQSWTQWAPYGVLLDTTVRRNPWGTLGLQHSHGSACRPREGLFQRLPSVVRNFHPRDLHYLAVGDHALGVCGHEPVAHQFEQQLGRKSVRGHEGFGAAVGRGGEQFERAAAGGLRSTVAR